MTTARICDYCGKIIKQTPIAGTDRYLNTGWQVSVNNLETGTSKLTDYHTECVNSYPEILPFKL